MILEDTYIMQENERKISNFGRLYYAVTVSDEHYKYLNFNDYMLKVKLDMTENAAFASTLSKEMLMSILENTNYFNENLDLEYVDSGLTLMEDKGYKDYFDGWFRHVDDDVYVMLLNMRYPLYVGREMVITFWLMILKMPLEYLKRNVVIYLSQTAILIQQ